RKRLVDFRAVPIQEKIFENGRCVVKPRPLNEIRSYCAEQVGKLWEEVTRFENPHRYYVDLSQKLWQMKETLISDHRY
ncbi:MAG TPA: nicotinate phosphoribosyltransferase, partial [Ruminococcaceae bacterium]|nr:nicotinate phosphoribosyltransferase [Oscillospiraceae bacterium]